MSSLLRFDADTDLSLELLIVLVKKEAAAAALPVVPLDEVPDACAEESSRQMLFRRSP